MGILGSVLGKSASDVVVKIGADTKEYDAALQKTETGLGSLTSKLKTAGPLVAAAAAAVAAGFVKMSVDMAAAEQVVSQQTASLLKVQGVLWEDVGGKVDAYMKQLERLTAYNDTDLQDSFNRLLSAGMSYNEALENMNTVTSLAYSKNLDLATAADLVGRAHNGVTGSLTRYGIVLGENQTLQEYVNDNLADATDRTKTYQGQMDMLKNSLMNTAEAFGNELLPGIISVMNAVNKWGESGGWSLITNGLFLFIDGARILYHHVSAVINILQALFSAFMMVNQAMYGNIDGAKKWKDELVKNVYEAKDSFDSFSEAQASMGKRTLEMIDTAMSFGSATNEAGAEVDYLGQAMGAATGTATGLGAALDDTSSSSDGFASSSKTASGYVSELSASLGIAETKLRNMTAAQVIAAREYQKWANERLGRDTFVDASDAMDIAWQQQEAEKAKKAAEQSAEEHERQNRLKSVAEGLSLETFEDYARQQLGITGGVAMSRAERDALKKQGKHYGYTREIESLDDGNQYWWLGKGGWNAADELDKDFSYIRQLLEQQATKESERQAEVERLQTEQQNYTGTGSTGPSVFNVNIYIENISEATSYENVHQIVSNAVQDAVRANG